MGIRVKRSGLRVEVSGFGIWDLGFKDWGLGFGTVPVRMPSLGWSPVDKGQFT